MPSQNESVLRLVTIGTSAALLTCGAILSFTLPTIFAPALSAGGFALCVLSWVTPAQPSGKTRASYVHDDSGSTWRNFCAKKAHYDVETKYDGPIADVVSHEFPHEQKNHTDMTVSNGSIAPDRMVA